MAGNFKLDCGRVEALFQEVVGKKEEALDELWELLQRPAVGSAKQVFPDANAEGVELSIRQKLWKQPPEWRDCNGFLEWVREAAQSAANEQRNYQVLVERIRKFKENPKDAYAWAALAKLWDQIGKYVERVTAGFPTLGDAQRVVDRVSLQLHDNPPEWQGVGEFIKWVKTCALNKAIDILREEKRLESLDAPRPGGDEAGVGARAEEIEDKRRQLGLGARMGMERVVRRALSSASQVHEILCWLANKVLGYKPQEIADCRYMPLGEWLEQHGDRLWHDGLAQQSYNDSRLGASRAKWDEWFQQVRAGMEEAPPADLYFGGPGLLIRHTCLNDYRSAGQDMARKISHWISEVDRRLLAAAAPEFRGEFREIRCRIALSDKKGQPPGPPHELLCFVEAEAFGLKPSEIIKRWGSAPLSEWFKDITVRCARGKSKFGHAGQWEKWLKPVLASLSAPTTGASRLVSQTCLNDYLRPLPDAAIAIEAWIQGIGKEADQAIKNKPLDLYSRALSQIDEAYLTLCYAALRFALWPAERLLEERNTPLSDLFGQLKRDLPGNTSLPEAVWEDLLEPLSTKMFKPPRSGYGGRRAVAGLTRLRDYVDGNNGRLGDMSPNGAKDTITTWVEQVHERLFPGKKGKPAFSE